jgi:Protein of unknown function (DUF3767)
MRHAGSGLRACAQTNSVRLKFDIIPDQSVKSLIEPSHAFAIPWTVADMAQGSNTEEPHPDPKNFQTNFPEHGNRDRPSITTAAQTIKPEDFLNIAQIPCGRQGLITGITTGAAIGGLRWILRGKSSALCLFRLASLIVRKVRSLAE